MTRMSLSRRSVLLGAVPAVGLLSLPGLASGKCSASPLRESIPFNGVVGQHQDPQAARPCSDCHDNCNTIEGGCIGGVASGCALGAAACGPFYGVCYVACLGTGSAVCVVAASACDSNCTNGTACEPVPCGDAFCDQGSTCLNATQGTCCTSDHPTPCGVNGTQPGQGTRCCLVTDKCIAGAPAGQECCSPKKVCGKHCCGADDACSDGVCCPTGTVSCDGKCCASHEACSHGVCCATDSVSCNGS